MCRLEIADEVKQFIVQAYRQDRSLLRVRRLVSDRYGVGVGVVRTSQILKAAGVEVRRGPTSHKNGVYTDSKGYVCLYVGRSHPQARAGGVVLEHILIMEQSLGRRLRPGEVVHHVDGDKANNRLENLRVMTRATHKWVHTELQRFDDDIRETIEKRTHGQALESDLLFSRLRTIFTELVLDPIIALAREADEPPALTERTVIHVG